MGLDTLTAFSADGHRARWLTWDGDHSETLTVRWENEGWTATGEVGREAVTYVVRLSATWQVRQFLLFRDLAEPDLWLATDGHGRWGEVNGAERGDLAGCTDVAITCTPFSHTLAIRRLDLAVGDSADLAPVTIDVDTLGAVRRHLRYTRVGPRRFVAEDRVTDEAEHFSVDDYGLVQDLADRFRRH